MSLIYLASTFAVFLVISMPTEFNCRSLKMEKTHAKRAESESEFSSKPFIVETKNSQKFNSGESLKKIKVKIEPSIVSLSSNIKLESSAMSLESSQESSVSFKKIPVVIEEKNSLEEMIVFNKRILKSQGKSKFSNEKTIKIEEKEPVVIDSLSKKIKIESSKILDSEEAEKIEVPFKVVEKKVPEKLIFEERNIKSKEGEFIEKPVKVEEKKPMVSKVWVSSKEAKKVEVPLIKEINKLPEDKLVFLKRGIVGKIDFGKKDFGLKKDFSKFDFGKKKLVI
jgi:hypothetical protein